jgi:helix-turn-helix protein
MTEVEELKQLVSELEEKITLLEQENQILIEQYKELALLAVAPWE